MVQVLCFTGRGFDTCWRPASVATNMVTLDNTLGAGYMNCSGPTTPIRFFTGDFT